MKKSIKYLPVLLLVMVACKKPYQPTVITVNYNYLVIDGVINASANGITTITLSRTKNLADSLPPKAELGAQVFIESDNNASYFLVPQGDGRYNSAPLNLGTSAKYRLRISTSNGSTYQSDFVPVKQTPPIDSISWQQDTSKKDVHIYAHTHDPQNNTRYYRWDYVETYQYNAQLFSFWGLSSTNHIYFIDSTTPQQYSCYTTAFSSNIAVATTEALSQDVVSYAPLITIKKNSELIGIRYSVNVKQYGLTQPAYQYWDILRKSTQQTGTIFDPQPSQTLGNIHCTSNPAEPVIGYASASYVTEKRIFIDTHQLVDWQYVIPGNDCQQGVTDQDPTDFTKYHYFDSSFGPWYYSGSQIVIVKKDCIDCRRRGGSSVKPSFW